MTSHLTYRLREGILFGTVAGKAFRLATLRQQPALEMETWRQVAQSAGTRVTDWAKRQEIRTGRVPAGPVQPRLTVAENAALEVYDYPGAFAQRFDGVDPGGAAGGSNHRHHGRVVWVKFANRPRFPDGGFHLHGPPPCGNPRCIGIGQDWESLFQALRTAGRLSVAVEL
jgi:hypothetical protein